MTTVCLATAALRRGKRSPIKPFSAADAVDELAKKRRSREDGELTTTSVTDESAAVSSSGDAE